MTLDELLLIKDALELQYSPMGKPFQSAIKILQREITLKTMNPVTGELDLNEIDQVCKHNIAWDVHCCNCHSGFIFDKGHHCPEPINDRSMRIPIKDN